MPVISKQTAYRIWTAHNQIETADKLLADIRETLQHGGDPTPDEPHNRHRRGYTLGVPHGSGERVLGVSPKLAAEVIDAYKDDKWFELIAACAVAEGEMHTVDIEFDDVEPPPAPVQLPDADDIVF